MEALALLSSRRRGMAARRMEAVQDRNRAAAEDPTLMAWAAGGDRLAFDQLVGRHLARVHGIAHRILRDPAAAEDATQDIWVQAWQQAGRFDPALGTVAAWLSRLAVSRSIDRLRRQRRQVTEALDLAAAVADPGPGPEAGLAARQAAQALARAVAGLPARQRAAIALVYDQELPGREAAAVLAVSPRGLEGLLRRARRLLGDRLGQRP
jgi:RNA polymerase sigma-70 factor (ECF subfamily)